MDTERYQFERELLGRKLPSNAFRFFYEGEDRPYLRVGAMTNNGNVYTLHIELSRFPVWAPEVFVTEMLKDRKGNPMSGVSAPMHTLSSEKGWTRICHYGSSAWTPYVTLYKVYVKCRLWLEMYEMHLLTGKPIDYYLNHQN